ncbi:MULTISPECIES: sulfite exporter TauE/SafE family protein [Nitrosomonas]|uniref:Probable membrane transporter protein n=2 Tax=Nitrosomonas communis TaxID=44574 RepID=A0A5D3YDD0_9PROT|nr:MULTISPECIES: sulfite exporter TauE/SafE family protein [Nitrosomonas]TYP85836.1 putative membrane protein YfcA [Nitrosomonas communis]UVS61723.1 sulfite exporter TauE/SafE family protein [Nitrosomonas sp. PLL12]
MTAVHMLSIEWLLLYAALGALVGFMSGLFGVGGSGILVPLLASLFAYQGIGTGQPVHLALGTALTCMIVTSAVSTRAHNARGSVEWKVVGGMTLGILVGAYAASQVAAKVNVAYIALFFAFFMGLVAMQIFIGWQPKPSNKPMRHHTLISVGMSIGAISALAAVGGSLLTILYLSYKNIEFKKAIGTSAAIGFPIAIAGAAGYMIGGWSATSDIPYTVGYLYAPAFITISITSIIAAPVGVRLSHNLPAGYMKKIFAVTSLLLSIKMCLSVAWD